MKRIRSQIPLSLLTRPSIDIWTERLRGKDIVVVNTGSQWGALTVSRLLTIIRRGRSAHFSHAGQRARTARYIDMAKQVLEHIDSPQSPTLIVRSAVPSSLNCSNEATPVNHLANLTELTAALSRQEDVETLNTIWRDLLQDHPRHLFLQVPPLPPTCGTLVDADAVVLNCLPGTLTPPGLMVSIFADAVVYRTDRYLEPPPQSRTLEQKPKLK